MTHYLDDAEWWTDNRGGRHPIKDMAGDEAQRIFNLLVRKAGQIAADYAVYLASIPTPTGDQAADSFEAAVDADLWEAQQNVYQWLVNKPLMQALRWRAENQPLRTACWCGHADSDHIKPGDDPRALCVGCTRRPIGTAKVPNRAFHEVSTFRPSDDELEANALGVRYDDKFKQSKADERRREAEAIRTQAVEEYEFPRDRLLDNPIPEYTPVEAEPGDEHRVFVVTTGAYSDYQVESVFVGDRDGANRRVHFLKLRGYREANIDIHNDSGCNSLETPAEVVDDPEVVVANYRTRIDVKTGLIVDQQAQSKFQRRSYVEPTATSIEHRKPTVVTGKAWRHEVEISTTGPATDLERIRKAHAERVAFVRAAVIEGVPFE